MQKGLLTGVLILMILMVTTVRSDISLFVRYSGTSCDNYPITAVGISFGTNSTCNDWKSQSPNDFDKCINGTISVCNPGSTEKELDSFAWSYTSAAKKPFLKSILFEGSENCSNPIDDDFIIFYSIADGICHLFGHSYGRYSIELEKNSYHVEYFDSASDCDKNNSSSSYNNSLGSCKNFGGPLSLRESLLENPNPATNAAVAINKPSLIAIMVAISISTVFSSIF